MQKEKGEREEQQRAKRNTIEWKDIHLHVAIFVTVKEVRFGSKLQELHCFLVHLCIEEKKERRNSQNLTMSVNGEGKNQYTDDLTAEKLFLYIEMQIYVCMYVCKTLCFYNEELYMHISLCFKKKNYIYVYRCWLQGDFLCSSFFRLV